MFTKSPQARAATAAARLPKLEVSRERVRTQLSAAQLRFHKVNSGRGVGALAAQFQGGDAPERRRSGAVQLVSSLQSQLTVLDRLRPQDRPVPLRGRLGARDPRGRTPRRPRPL